MEKTYWPLEKLKPWNKNPRSINESDFKRLKKQIETLGEYKPLIVTEDGTVLGGNMRLRAYLELGWQQVWVSVVEAETEEDKLAYALSDNDRAGHYDELALAELLIDVKELELDDFHIDLGVSVPVKSLLDKVSPTDPEIPDESDGGSKTITCPECGHKW